MLDVVVYALAGVAAVFFVMNLQPKKTFVISSQFSSLRNYVGPGPSNWIFGNILEMRDGEAGLDVGRRWMLQFPKRALIWVSGWKPVCITWHPDTVKDVLKASYTIAPKAKTYRLLHSWLGLGLLTSAGSLWHSRRKMLTPAFHFDLLKDFHSVFAKHTSTLISHWKQKATTNESFDVFMDVKLLTLDSICSASMGTEVHAIEEEDSEYVRSVNKAAETIWWRMLRPWFWPDLIFGLTPVGRAYNSCVDLLHQYTETVIHKRREELEDKLAKHSFKPKSFLDILLLATKENGDGLTDQEIQDEVDTFMFEGHDTTAAGLAWTLYSFATNPECQQKAADEANKVLAGRSSPDIEDLGELEYLECCISESLRLFPPVPMIGRQLESDLTVDGTFFPAGVEFNVDIYSLHHNPTVWKDAETFDPTRWLKGSDERENFAYVPFSAGARNCIGQKFALNEMRVALCMLLNRFEFSFDEDHPIARGPELILRPLNGVWLKIKERS